MGRTYQLRALEAAVLLALLGAAVALAEEKSRSAVAFEQMASLVGEWKAVQGDTEIELIYKLVADGTALMEEFRPANQPAMITMFSVDGDRLLATHYCSAGNQPQMATAAITEAPEKSLAFSLVRVTGLTTPQDWHNTGLVMILEEKERLRQEWTYEHRGKSGSSIFEFKRAQ